MSLTAISAATQILANASKTLDSVREQAKGSKDAALKESINNLWDLFLDLRAAVLRVGEENAELKATAGPKIRQVGAVNYYYKEDEGPFCQPCFDDKKKLIALTPVEEWNGGQRRQCMVCRNYFYEKPMTEFVGPIVVR